MKAKWKDITGYSQGDNTCIPRTWELASGNMQIIVSRKHYAPGDWYLTTYHPEICTDVSLKTDDAEQAKSKAIEIVRHRLQSITSMFDDSVAQMKITGPIPNNK